MNAAILRRTAASALDSLAAGLRIDVERGLPPLSTRVALSAGTQPVAAEVPDLAQQYTADAIIPRRPWREASFEELRRLRFDAAAGDAWRRGADGAVVRLPQALIAPLTAVLEREGARATTAVDVRAAIEADPLWMAGVAALSRYLTARYRTRFDHAIFRITAPGLVTLTQGDDRRQRIGLHLDSWDRMPLRHRHRSRNRICINLGREARAVLLINLPLMDLFKQLGLDDPADILADFRGLLLGARFMRERPDYPALRLRIDPGEAYVLPTDNLMHDASSEGSACPDITLTFIGRIAHQPDAAEQG
jgi:predicted Zn-dependent protease with MMP-like domain